MSPPHRSPNVCSLRGTLRILAFSPMHMTKGQPKMASAAPPHGRSHRWRAHAFHINLSKGSGAWNEVTYHLSILGTLHWRRQRCIHCVTRLAVILILLLSKMFDIRLIGSTQNVTWLCAAGMGATAVAISWLTVNKAYVSWNWFFWSLWRRRSTIWGLIVAVVLTAARDVTSLPDEGRSAVIEIYF